MELFEHNGKWLIVVNPHQVGGDGISGSRSRSSERVRWTFDKCWSGDRWVGQVAFGKLFETEAEAIQYRQDNWERMEEGL